MFEPGLVTVRGTDDGGRIELHTGNTLEVSLDANPSTGYTWTMESDLRGILEEVGEPEFEATGDALGGGGTLTMRYQAVRTGELELRLAYRRAFEPVDPPERTFTITVAVV